MSTYEEKLADLQKKYGGGGWTAPSPSASQGSTGNTFEERAAAIKQKWGAPAGSAPSPSTDAYPKADYGQTMADAVPVHPIKPPSTGVNFAPTDQNQISPGAPDFGNVPVAAAKPVAPVSDSWPPASANVHPAGRARILEDPNTGTQPIIKEYDFAKAGAEVGAPLTWRDAEAEKIARKYAPSQTPEGLAATSAAADKATQEYQGRLQATKADPSRLATAIVEGRIRPRDLTDLTPDKFDWNAIAGAVTQSQFTGSPTPGAGDILQIAERAKNDPATAHQNLMNLLQSREDGKGFQFLRGVREGGTEALTLGYVAPDTLPETGAEKAGSVTGAIVGSLPALAVAGATGGASAEALATRLIPAALEGTELAGNVARIAKGVGTGLALQGGREGAAYARTGEVQPGIGQRLGREAAFFGVLDAASPYLGAAAGKGAGQALPQAIRDTALGRAIEGGASGAVSGGTTSLLVNSLFPSDDEQDKSVWSRVLNDAATIGLFGAVRGAVGSAETTNFKTQTGPEIIGQQIEGRIYRGIPDGELAAAQQAKGDLSRLGYTEYKPGSGVWQKRGLDGTLTGEIHEDVMVNGRQVPKIVADRAARFNPTTQDATPAEPQAPGALPEPAAAQAAPVVEAPATIPRAEPSAPPAMSAVPIDRAALLRTANPAMDERAILDMVKTTGNLSDAEFPAFAARVGTSGDAAPEKATASTSQVQPQAYDPSAPASADNFPFATKDIPLVRYQKEQGAAVPSALRGGTWFNAVNTVHGETTGYQQDGKAAGGQQKVAETFTPKNPLLTVDNEAYGAGDAAIRKLAGDDFLAKVQEAAHNDTALREVLAGLGVPEGDITALAKHPDRAFAVPDRVGTELAKRAGYDSIIHTTQNGLYTEVVKLAPTVTQGKAPALTTNAAPAVPAAPVPGAQGFSAPAAEATTPQPAQTTAPVAPGAASDLEQARQRVVAAGTAIDTVLDPVMATVYDPGDQWKGPVTIGKLTTHVMNGGEVSSQALQNAIKVPQNVANALNNAYHSSKALRDAITERGDAIAALTPLETAKRQAQESAQTSTPAPSADAKPATAPAKTIATGNTAAAKTERGTEVQTQYALVDAGNLVASHDTALKATPNYPQELQPRDRSRVASEDQINRIVGNLEPEFLGASPKASEGAPIVGPDLVVESGNGRTIALQRAYEQGHKNAETYKAWLVDNAKTFGLDPQAVTDATSPVLVRVRQTEVNRADFASQANEQSVAAMSATEQAVSDSKKLTGEVMHWFNPSGAGEIVHPGNRDFIRAFLQKVVGPTEQGRYLTADGTLSQEGIGRIRNAVFARAYGDSSAIEKLAESPDNNVRSITTGMLTAAGRIAQVKEGIAKGQYFPVDLSQDITAAMAKLSQLRESGQTVAEFLHPKQLALFGDDLSPLAKDILDVFEQHKRSPKKIGALLMAYADAVEAAGDPRQQTLWGKASPTRAELWQAAVQTMEADAGGGVQASLFEDPGAGGPGVATANEAGGSAAQTEQGQGKGYTLKDALAEERGGISMPGRKPVPVDPLTKELDESISWNDQKTTTTTRPPVKSVIANAVDKIVDEAFDRTDSLRRAQVKLAAGKELTPDMDAYLHIQILAKTMPGATEAAVHELTAILQPLGSHIRDYARYADARATLVRAQNKGYSFDEHKLPMKEETARKFIDRIDQGPDAKQFREVFQKEQKLYDSGLDELVKAGVYDRETVNKMRDAHAVKDANGNTVSIDYIPLLRDMSAEADAAGNPVKTGAESAGVAGQGKNLRNTPNATNRQEGSSRKLMDPFERRIRYLARVMGVAQRNRVLVSLDKFTDTFDGTSEVWSKVAPPMAHGQVKVSDIMAGLEDLGADPQDFQDPNAVVEFFQPKGMRDADPNIVRFFRDGQVQHRYVKDAAILKTLTHTDPATENVVLKALEWGVKAYKKGATISPGWSIGNVVRDTWESYRYSAHQWLPGQAMFEALKLVAARDPFVQRMVDAGVKQGGFLQPEKQSINILKQIEDPRGTFVSPATIWKLYQETREQPEFWTRMGEGHLEYKDRLKQYGELVKQGKATPEQADEWAFLKAIYEAGRITLNFTRSGYTVGQANKYVPFGKIPFESAYRATEAIREKRRAFYDPRSFWFKTILPAIGVATTTVLLNRNNKQYMEASDQERDKYMLVPLFGALIRVPKPQGDFGVVMNLAERTLRRWQLDDRTAFDGWATNAASDLFPRVTNPAFELIVGLRTNQDLYNDRAIIPQSELGRSGRLQYDNQTPWPLVGIGQATNVSPRKQQFVIDKLFPGYSDGFKMLSSWSQRGYQAAKGQEVPQSPSMKPEDYPVVGRFISRPGEGKQGKSVSLFYDRLQQADQVYNDLRGGIEKESGHPVQMDSLTGTQLRIRNKLISGMNPEDRALLSRRNGIAKWNDQLGNLRKKRDEIDANRSMNPDAKKGALEQINRQLTDTAQRALQATK